MYDRIGETWRYVDDRFCHLDGEVMVLTRPIMVRIVIKVGVDSMVGITDIYRNLNWLMVHVTHSQRTCIWLGVT